VAEQMQQFFDKTLVDLGMEVVTRRRRTRNIVGKLGFLSSWKVPEPKVITEPPGQSEPPDGDGGVADSTDQPSDLPADESGTIDHVLPYRQRLDPASVEDVQRVTRIWASSIERYPAAYVGLDEDRISDLLAATLNATLPGAQREVYSRGGKSDIFIQADVLKEGSGPAKIFICESKWSRGKSWVSGAIDPQLFGYLTVHDTSAVLLLLFDQKHFRRAQSNAYGWLKGVSGCLREEASAVDGWPIFIYKSGQLIVRICVASVAVQPLRPRVEGATAE
jgi:hypothetical protein